jgi:hypothetical protein
MTAQPYDAEFEARLTFGDIPHKVLDYDIENEYYWGDFDNGGIRSLNDYPLLEEIAIDELTNKEILSKYPVHAQLNIIANCLNAAGIPLTPEFTEMRNWINQKAAKHNQAIQTYKENPDVYSFNPKPIPPVDE